MVHKLLDSLNLFVSSIPLLLVPGNSTHFLREMITAKHVLIIKHMWFILCTELFKELFQHLLFLFKIDGIVNQIDNAILIQRDHIILLFLSFQNKKLLKIPVILSTSFYIQNYSFCWRAIAVKMSDF